MKILILFFLLSTSILGQTFLPIKDTIIKQKDGSEIRYTIQPHAIYLTTYKNGMWEGIHKSFYKNGNLWHIDYRKNGKIEGKAFDFTPNGDTASIQEWKESVLYDEIVFYNSTRKDNQKYFFVSKTGFHRIINGVYTPLNQNAPDSLIEEGPNYTYIFIKGEKKLLYGEESPKFITILDGDKPGFYKISGGEKIFFREFTEAEKKLFYKKEEKHK